MCFPLCLLRHYPNKYTIFSWEWSCIFKCSSGLLKQSGRNTIGCCIHLKTEEQSHLFQTGLHRIEVGDLMLIHRKQRFFCSLPSCPVQLCPAVPAVILVFSDTSVHLWEYSSTERFNLLLFWARVLQKYICLPRSSMVTEEL